MALESLADEGASQRSATPLADTDGRSKRNSWQSFVGQQHNGDCRLGVHGSIPTASAYGHLLEAALTWERVTLTNLRRQRYTTDCRLEYIDFESRGCGFESHRPGSITERAVAQTDRALRLWSTLRRSLFTTTRSSRLPSWSTLLITRMLWVRVPPAQLRCTSRRSSMVERRNVSDSSLRRDFLLARVSRLLLPSSMGCTLRTTGQSHRTNTLDCRFGVHGLAGSIPARST